MHRPSRKSGLVIGSVLALSLLFNSIVYACSGLMGMSLHAASINSMNTMGGMNENTIERGPCADHKQDVCKSVRDRMLSVQPSGYKAIDSQQTIILYLPLNLIIDIPKHIAFSSGSLTWQTAFHAVFKLPLPFSLRVLRI
jgi:hypothetical protein